jgi:hypothetical protein
LAAPLLGMGSFITITALVAVGIGAVLVLGAAVSMIPRRGEPGYIFRMHPVRAMRWHFAHMALKISIFYFPHLIPSGFRQLRQAILGLDSHWSRGRGQDRGPQRDYGLTLDYWFNLQRGWVVFTWCYKAWLYVAVFFAFGILLSLPFGDEYRRRVEAGYYERLAPTTTTYRAKEALKQTMERWQPEQSYAVALAEAELASAHQRLQKVHQEQRETQELIASLERRLTESRQEGHDLATRDTARSLRDELAK